jgi:NAD(P)-dependent dehydrogenase (short-subunit alcohol dehydrogenase family)
MGRLIGKTALVTGSGSGIGKTAALLFALEGAQVVVSEINEESGSATAAAIAEAGGEALFVKTDVTDEESVAGSIEAATKRFGKLDILYNNAGGSTTADGTVTDAPIEEFWRAIKVDLFGTWLNCRFGIPALIAAGGGSVINTSSVAGIKGTAGFDCYTAAKGGIIALTRSLAVEYGRHGIRVNAIAPGATLTERILRRSDSAFVKASESRPPLLGLANPIEIAHAALYFASPESRVTTGHILVVDSGYSL